MVDLNKVKASDLNVYSRLLDYICTEDDIENPASTVVSSNDRKYLATNNKNGNLISTLTTSVLAIKDDTSVENIAKELENINVNILQLRSHEPINSSANMMILLKSLPWDDSKLTLVLIEQLFKNLHILTGVELYYQMFQRLKIKKLGPGSKELNTEDFRANLQIDSLNLVESLRLLSNAKEKEFWSLCIILAMREIKMYDTVEELQALIYWDDYSENSYLDLLLSKIDKQILGEEERIVYCQGLLLRGTKQDYRTVISLIEKDIDDKSGNINLYLKNIVIEACEKSQDEKQMYSICHKLLKSLNDYEVLLKYVCTYLSLNKSSTKQELVKTLEEEFPHFIKTRNFRLIKVYLDYKIDGQFGNLNNYLDVYNDKLCCIPDLSSLVPKDTLLHSLMEYDSSPTRDYNIYQITKTKENLSKIDESIDYQEITIVDKLNNKTSFKINEYLDILSMLKDLSQNHPESFQFKLLKMVVYNNLTLYKKASACYDELSIKNLQKLSMDSLINNFIPESSPKTDISGVDEVSNFGYILSLTLEKKSYSKFASLLKFAIKLNNSNVALLKHLNSIRRQRFFGNKQYRGVLNSLVGPLLKHGIESTKDDALFLPHDLIGKWDYSSNENELWYALLNEFYIMKSLDGGALKYERIIRIISQEKLSTQYESGNQLLKWQFEFFEKYSQISDDNEKIVSFLEQVAIPDVLAGSANLKSDQQPWQILDNYIRVLETFKTLDSIKKFQNNKALKAKIKPLLKKVREENCKVIEAYTSYFEDATDFEIRQLVNTQVHLVQSL